MAHRRSHVAIVVHIVWSTHRRSPYLPPERDTWLTDLLSRKASELGCEIVAAGFATDHIHILTTLAPTISVSKLVGVLKGAASRACGLEGIGARPTWQDGYWAESCKPRNLDALVHSILNQRSHHARSDNDDRSCADEAWEREQDQDKPHSALR